MIRRARADDLDTIHALDHESVSHHRAFDPDFFTISEGSWAEKRVSQNQALHDGNEEVFVFDDGAGIGGYMWGYVEERSVSRIGIVQELVVSVSRRREGIARGLVSSLLERFKERGCSACEVVVFSENDPAIRLYEAVGFSKRTCTMRCVLDRS
jgi:ribosomal protein S18 acetylase RimI-like enzyme